MEVYCESPFFNVFQGVFKNFRQINVYCNIKIIFMWRIVSSNIEMTEILNFWLSQFKACPSPLGAFVKWCTSHVFLWWDIFMKDQPEGGEFVLFYLMYYSLPHLKMTISVLIYDSVIHWIVANRQASTVQMTYRRIQVQAKITTRERMENRQFD